MLTLQLSAMALVVVTTLVSAHHSFAMFDQKKRIVVKGTVSKLEWGNPHVYIFVQTAGADGVPKEYTIEGGSINILSRAGWKANTIKVGDAVSMSFYPLRDGQPGGLLDSVTLPNGTVMKQE